MDIKTLQKEYSLCTCGKAHHCPIDYVYIGTNAMEKLLAYCTFAKKIVLVADDNTWACCGGEEILRTFASQVQASIILDEKPCVVPDEHSIAIIEAAITPETELLIGFGSGVINDLCKHVSFKHDLPYCIYATAPSMDGYASAGAAMILKGMKVTLNARTPKAIFADTQVLCHAPFHMIQAGWGDIIGKYSCLNDWKLSALVNGEYFCQRLYDLVMDTVKQTENNAPDILEKKPEAIAFLMEALIVVGIAMAFAGNSRPASGSEHHMAHYFEITGILNKTPYYAHGLDVLYSAVVTAELREKIIAADIKKATFDRAEWEKEIRRIYTSIADEVIALQDKMGWYQRDDTQKLTELKPEINRILAEAPTAAQMKEIVSKIGLKYEDYLSFYGEKKIEDGVRFCKDLKDRYTVLWLNRSI